LTSNKKTIIPLSKEKIKQDNIKKLEAKRIAKIKYKHDTPIINELIKNFMDTFGALEINNKEFNGFSLSNIEVHNYGCSSKIYAPKGMVLPDLEKYTPLIETGCKCKFLYDIPEHNQFAMVKFIKPEQVEINSWELVPIKLRPWEFCPGYNIDGSVIKLNLNNTPHILLAGQTRRGKNGAADHAVASWINSCDETEIVFYMLQVANNDFEKYKYCKQVYCYTDKLEEMLVALEHLNIEMKNRARLFSPMMMKANGKDTIAFYNQTHIHDKLPYIILIVDEFIVLMPDSLVDDKDTKKIKAKILNYIQQIGQFGGKLGVNCMILHQKPSAALMPVFLKNMSNIRICFGFDDLICCSIVLGDELARNAYRLPHWRAFYTNNENKGFMYTPNMSNGVAKLIESSKVINHRNVFSDLKKQNSNSNDIKVNPTVDTEFEEILKDKGTAPLPKKLKVEDVLIVPAIVQEEIMVKINTSGRMIANIKDIPDFKYYMTKHEIIIPAAIEPIAEPDVIKEIVPEMKKVDVSKYIYKKEQSKVNVFKTDNEILLENIKKIDGFVPYNP